MSLFDAHDLQNPDQVFTVIDLVTRGDMDTVYPIRMRKGEEFAAPGQWMTSRR